MRVRLSAFACFVLSLDLSLGGQAYAALTVPTVTKAFSLAKVDPHHTSGKAFDLDVSSQLSIVTASPLPSAVPNTIYSQAFSASGGSGDYVDWSVTEGALPTWAKLDAATGVLSGTPTDAGEAQLGFTIQVTDSAAGMATKAFLIPVATGITPIAVGDGIVITPGASTSTVNGSDVSVLANDYNVGLNAFNLQMTAAVVTNPSHGTLVAFNPDGTFTYKNTSGSGDSFQYQACDGTTDLCSTATVKITVVPAGPLPTIVLPEVVSDAAIVKAGNNTSVLSDGSASVLANDIDPISGGQLVASKVGPDPIYGTLLFNLLGQASGTFTYNTSKIAPSDVFYYQACDSLYGACSLASVTVTIWSSVQPVPTILLPIAVDDEIQVTPGSTTKIVIGGSETVLWNDADQNGSAQNPGVLSAGLVGSGPQHGDLQFNVVGPGDGTFEYSNHLNDPATTDSFVYQACDSLFGVCASAIVSIEITGNPILNQLPDAGIDAIVVAKGGSASILVGGATSVLANDVDPDSAETGSLKAYLVGSTTQHGVLMLNNDGTFLYTNEENDSSQNDNFVYEACDIHGACTAASVSITIGSAPGPDPTVSCVLPKQVYLAGAGGADGTTDVVSIDMTKLFAPPAGDSLTYGVSGLPSSLQVNASTGLLSGTLGSLDYVGAPFSALLTATAVAAGTSVFQVVAFDVLSQTDHLFRNGFDLPPQLCQ
jgi:hypothetical protein